MANNCYNHITITGSEEEIKHFNSLITGEEGSDIYENLQNNFGKHKNDARWFIIDLIINNESEITISGDSAWCPSLNLFHEIAKKYLSFKIVYWYEEMGCDFSGRTTYQNGEMEDESYNYWEGIAVLDPGDYLERARNEFEAYDTEQEFSESDVYKYCPKDLKIILLEEYNT